METTLKRAVASDGRSLYAIAKAADIYYEPLRRFMRCGGGLQLATAAAIAETVGLSLQPVDKSERKGG